LSALKNFNSKPLNIFKKTQPKSLQNNQVLQDARHDRAHAAAVSAILGKVKVLGIVDKPQANTQDFKAARSMQDIGRKLLQSVGLASPDDASIQAAIEANDAFVGRLEAIRDAAQGLAIDQDD
jgi:hypothetical protein